MITINKKNTLLSLLITFASSSVYATDITSYDTMTHFDYYIKDNSFYVQWDPNGSRYIKDISITGGGGVYLESIRDPDLMIGEEKNTPAYSKPLKISGIIESENNEFNLNVSYSYCDKESCYKITRRIEG